MKNTAIAIAVVLGAVAGFIMAVVVFEVLLYLTAMHPLAAFLIVLTMPILAFGVVVKRRLDRAKSPTVTQVDA